MPTLRLFIAAPVEPTPAIRRVLDRLETLRPTVTPVSPEQLHFTLRFLGDTEQARVEPIGQALERAAAQARTGPIELRFPRLGRFPPAGGGPQAARAPRLPRVIFAEPEGAGPLHELAGAVQAELTSLTPPIPPDDRPFRAHLTLARVKRPRPGPGKRRRRPRYQAAAPDPARTIADLLAEAENLGTARLDRLALIASELTSAGPIHRPQHVVRLDW